MESFGHILEEAGRCVRCGACRSGCPTFEAIRREPASARGKVSLIEARMKGDAELGEAYLGHIKNCALCGSCYSACPKGVNIPELVMQARAESVARDGLPLAAALTLKGVLGFGRVMPVAFKFASLFQKVLLKGGSSETGLVSRFPLPLIGHGRLLPELPEQSFLDRPEIKARGLKAPQDGPVDSSLPSVGFFVGCGINYLLPGIGEAAIRVLESSGARVVVPEGQVCCGLPAVSLGEVSTARSQALKTLDAFEKSGFDYITTACATCTSTLKYNFMKLLGGEGLLMRERVEKFSSRVKDVTELLSGSFSYEGDEKKKRGESVTYHDPCHLSRYQGIKGAPRELLELTGMNFKGMKRPCKCCGLGGGLAFTNYELSMEIARNKIEDINGTGADVVATACPGCILNLRDAQHRFGGKARIVHVVELL